MEILELSLHSSNQLVNDLMNNQLHIPAFFDYDICNKQSFKERATDLKNRSFQREELSAYLMQYATRFSNQNKKTIANIEKLKDPNSVVVIGGQQAGLLTGPLYTIHKILSIVVFAKEQEEELGIPVIPVFWIAGEDHDFAEINHIFASKNKIPKKIAIKDSPLKKQSVSDMLLNQRKVLEWLDDVFVQFGETDHTNSLIDNLKNYVKKSTTYVEFFEYIIMDLFKHEGLVLINSGDPKLRELEKQCFHAIINQNERIYEAVTAQQEMMRDKQYRPIIEMGKNSANLFYHHDGERFLMERKGENEFLVPEIGLTLTKEELHHLIESYPEKLSNNVVTRPLMQEYLFPTLAFFAGPGEVTYWAELKQAFSIMEIKMPPVLPRLMITFLERSIERNLNEAQLSLETVLKNGINQAVTDYLAAATPVNIDPLISNAKQEIAKIHKELLEEAIKIDKSMQPMLEKNGMFILQQLDFFNRNVEKRVKQIHEIQLTKFKEIELSLLPNLVPQERMWNVFYYLNKFGPNFVEELLNLSYSFNGKHKIVKI
ncbi:bacillithiol biosynthesis cysteine-adding enzyme BshC [Metabacillus malikii]|uniref:Putative cysteine ligase BshC n=1 Tax=Metabacillus malikii TaxID=1504265 RepID=A0ABT9ZG70_9BACI|nr:bacillithiol biosynthesis cysteine-adding enzyme BshC [Metabacillus malikii]MDQ0231280.1 bacillithiol biosynthesis cysteine-adding enzyme BshC [Metabacillus malikii]